MQKAFELAELVLNDPAQWNQETMAAVLATKKMQTEYLAKPVPVLPVLDRAAAAGWPGGFS